MIEYIYTSMEIATFYSLIDDVINNKLSDLHITTGDYPYIRIRDGSLQPVIAFGKVALKEVEDIIRFVYKDLEEKTKTVDTAYERGSARFRINISRVLHGWSISFRLIPQDIPTPADIGIDDSILRLTTKEK